MFNFLKNVFIVVCLSIGITIALSIVIVLSYISGREVYFNNEDL